MSSNTNRSSTSTPRSSSTLSPSLTSTAGPAANSAHSPSNLEAQPTGQGRRSSLGALVSKTGRKLSDTLTRKGKDRDVLADDEEDYERQKVKEEKKEQRKADYERLGLEDKVKWGSKGGMSMS